MPSSPLHRGGCKRSAAIDEVVGGSIFIRLACGSVVGHGLQHLRSRIDLGRARAHSKKMTCFQRGFFVLTHGAFLSDPETCEG